ncbi:hypothetical protein EB796_024450 [Bugula neritina]|uniref:Uncharacterized protein n=1 Tax=Bugula neritina TaxID=10212 RepID=A0A7J7IV08_BUGNE|nr:hypothetical protein EB796_024450 [Bugula neritina]
MIRRAGGFLTESIWLILRRLYRPALGLCTATFCLLIKLLYLTNAVGQLFLLNHFLGDSGYTLWGFKALKEFFRTGTMGFSEIFPTITLCDVDFFTMGLSADLVLVVSRFGHDVHRHHSMD